MDTQIPLPTNEDLAALIEAYCAERGMARTTFGSMHFGDASFVDRLKAGRDHRISTLRKLRYVLESAK